MKASKLVLRMVGAALLAMLLFAAGSANVPAAASGAR
jgi:hypothetical protein